MSRHSSRQSGTRAIIWFVARFVGAWLLALGVLAVSPGIERWCIAAMTDNLLLILRAIGADVSREGATLTVGRASLMIVAECTIVMPMLVLGAAIIAYPARLRWRLGGIGCGAVVLWIYNLFRVLALLAVMVWYPQLFDFVHVYLWQTFTLIVVLALFALWLRLQPVPRGTG